MKYRKVLTWIMILVIIGGGFAAMQILISLKPEPPRATVKKQKRLVETRLVQYGDVETAIEVPGRLASGRVVEIISEVQGEILPGNVPLKKGQGFSRGELLCTIYDTEQVLTIKASKSRFLNSLANALPDVNFDYPDKYDKILDFFESVELDEPMPEMPEIDDKSLKVFLASRDILSQYYSIKVAEERLQKHYIRAPFSGTFLEVSLEAGGIANPGTRIARIIETQVLELEVPVVVDELRWIHTGDRVQVFNERRTHSWQGTVTRISEFVDPETQSVGVFVRIQNTRDNPVYSGMYLVARFDSKTVEHAMEIPRQAVFNQNEVFIVQDSSLVKKKIDIRKINENTLIFNGLNEGLELVVEPLINVKEGTMVKTNRL